MSNKSVEQVGSDLLISSKKASIARFPFGLGTAGGDGDCSHVAKSRSRTDQHTLDGSNARMGRECTSDRDNPDGVYAAPESFKGRTKLLDFVLRRVGALSSASNASRNSAYAFAACSSSSFRLASAASFSFSLFDFFTVPWAYWESFWSSTVFCYRRSYGERRGTGREVLSVALETKSRLRHCQKKWPT
jgi:hypothetical protein